ncbi:MAG: helix-turn-helix domain-containing protein [Acidobacteriota bacterium]
MTSPSLLLSTTEASPRHRLSSEDRRQQLIACAIDLFAKRGFAGTRTKDIAAACGVSEGILFRHFATKEDLYHAILDTHEDEAGAQAWFEEMKRLAVEGDDAGFIHCLVTKLIQTFRDEATFHRLMIYARLEGHSLVDLLNQRMGKPCMGFLRDFVVERQQQGVFRPGNPDAQVMFLFALPVQYAMTRYVFEMDLLQLPDEKAAEEITPLLLAGLRQFRK